LGGRIIRMAPKGGADVLRVPKPSEDGYPALAGQSVQAFPDFPLRAWNTTWRSAESPAGEVRMEGTCPNGVVLTRRIRLEGDWVRTEVTASNTTSQPLEMVLQARAEFEPGDIDSARVRYRSSAGAEVNGAVLTPGEQPTGNEMYKEVSVPAGSWTLVRTGIPAVENRFPAELAERTSLNWTAKGGPRVTFGVWSKKRTVPAGGSLRLESDYR
jgi:hypothetical protein